MMRRLALSVFVFLLAAMAGCAIKPGMSRDEVLSTWGRPTAELDRGGVHRLQYSRQPLGQSVVMVDLDPAGRVAEAREMMNLNEFSKIDISGKTTRDDILWAFGPPAKIDGVASWRGDIWSYRWKDLDNMWFWVYFDPNGVVRRTQQGPDLPIFPQFR